MKIEVQGETEVMIPDSMRRLEVALEDLHDFVVSGACGTEARRVVAVRMSWSRGGRADGTRGRVTLLGYITPAMLLSSCTRPHTRVQAVHAADDGLAGSEQLLAAQHVLERERNDAVDEDADERI